MATGQDVVNYALTMLAQTQASIAAGLPSGGGEADDYAIPSNTQLLLWVTEAQNRLARLCVPIPDYAAVQAPAVGSQALSSYVNIQSPSGREMHQATEVYIGSKRLTPANMGYLRASNWYPSAINGDPTAWANNNSGISLSFYTTQPWFLINGYFLPVAVTSLSQALDAYLDDYCQLAMAFYVAWRVATKNLDNNVLAERAGPCAQEFGNTVREIYTRLISNDQTLSAIFTPQAIDSQVNLMRQSMVKT